MKIALSIVLLILVLNSISAQQTEIPDVNFEQALIDLEYDTGTPDGYIPTDNISSLTVLNVSSKAISDLTGIEDFASLKDLTCVSNQLINLDLSGNSELETLYCQDNNLTNLNISNNTSLVNLDCSNNKLTNLNVSNNVNLSILYCLNNLLTSLDLHNNTGLTKLDSDFNQLTNIDVSQNLSLFYLSCSDNQLVNLNISDNPAIIYLTCENNDLITLNLKNGNNKNFDYFNSVNNHNLECIQVDDPEWSTNNWENIDGTASFSIDCEYSSLDEHYINNNLSEIIVYPNPTKGDINILFGENRGYSQIILMNSNGQIVFAQDFKKSDLIKLQFNVPTGIYCLILNNSTIEYKVIKIVKE